MPTGTPRLAAALAVVTLALTVPALPAAADVAHGTPNDPGYAQCENGPSAQPPGCGDNEQWDLYGQLQGDTCPPPLTAQPAVLPHPDGGLPCWAYGATDPQHAAGVNDPGAWTQGNLGDGVLVAYIEGGVNYSNDGIKDSLDNISINRGELPYPERADGTTKTSGDPYDLNGDGHFDIRDYAYDPRVNPPCAPGAPTTVHLDVEGVTFGCVAGGQHQYLNAVSVAGTRTPYLTPEDLIAVFGHCQMRNGLLVQCPVGGRFDNDGNGYPNDVSGWNFDRNTNDPQTEDLNYSHAPGLISLIGGAPDNGYAGVGVCPHCRVVPIKQGSECLGRSDRWGEAILYATDLGASVISSVVVEYSYSSFSQAAVNYAYEHGVVLSLDSNDFDSMDHTDGMLFDHALPGNSLFEDKGGPASNATTYFRARSNVTSYGTHNVFSGEEVTTSGATPFQASMLAMTQSAALQAVQQGVLPSRLSPNEVKQVLMDTASPVVPQTQSPQTPRQWPGNPNSATDATHTNWSTQYGYGRPDLGAATSMILAGHVPPTADITGPHWYSYVDPTRQSTLPVTGSLAPSRVHTGGSAKWVLEYALGADPADSAFVTVAQGTTSRPLSGTLGSIDLSKIPASFSTAAPGTTLQPDGAEQYTVSIRLRVVDSNGIKAEDRRSIGVRHDPSLTAGFPRYVGGEPATGTAYVDLEGRHELDLVVGTADGVVHAWRPDGSEVAGFPVTTDTDASVDPNSPENLHAAAYRDPALRDVRDPVSGLAVGDLFHDGRLEVVANTTNGDVYAWDPQGTRLSGFPLHTNPAYWTVAVPTPRAPTTHGRLPNRGSLLPATLADLEGNGQLDIVLSAYDGFVYAWRPDGTPVPGWPVEIKLPPSIMQRDGVDPSQYIRDAKLLYSVGVADVLKTGHPQVFVSSFEGNGVSTSTQDLAASLAGIDTGNPKAATWLYGVWPDGTDHAGGAFLPNWPVKVPALSFAYDQSIDFVGESTSPPIFADVDGSGTLRVVTSAVTGQVLVLNGDGSTYKKLDLSCQSADCAPNPPYRPTGDTHTITLTSQPVLGDLTGSGHPQVVEDSTGVESIVSALSIPGQAAVPQVYEKAWDPTTGSVLSGFPKRVDGFPFYSAPVVAGLGGAAGTRAVVDTNDNYWVHAFGSDGSEVAGFPKYTGQWVSFAGAIADPGMDGHLHYVVGTREGWVFDWSVGGDTALNNAWWHYRHDERNTGLYGLDTRRPAVVADLRDPGGVTLSWTAPGNDYAVGTAARYDVRTSSSPITDATFASATPLSGAPPPQKAGTAQSMTVPDPPAGGTEYVAMRTVDAAGNVSALSDVVCLGDCPPSHPHGAALGLIGAPNTTAGNGAAGAAGILAACAMVAWTLGRRRGTVRRAVPRHQRVSGWEAAAPGRTARPGG